ncbi:hypothetical protein GPECTOR_18g170 [Gonium pectorale]|uniref:Protein kinase domain-containing protein n=1 Tax=Gonium pectorale TaxID=33097 RepID=A0A150GJN5_GONPE|nr:hypothetical protein GPECTOR_18g170 [Gonium pectorale]|eukprot:KXZ50017.1 hypothetical protein GPECTOR_18g170 [Gonium pectorale]
MCKGVTLVQARGQKRMRGLPTVATGLPMPGAASRCTRTATPPPRLPASAPSNATRSLTLALHAGARASTSPIEQWLSLLALRNTASTDRSTPNGRITRGNTPPSLGRLRDGTATGTGAATNGDAAHSRPLTPPSDPSVPPPPQWPPLPRAPSTSSLATALGRAAAIAKGKDVDGDSGAGAPAAAAEHSDSRPRSVNIAVAAAAGAAAASARHVGRIASVPLAAPSAPAAVPPAGRRLSLDRAARQRRHSNASSVAGSVAGSDYLSPMGRLRPLCTEELAALVTSLAAVRGHWLGALEAAVAAAADLLGADSVSLHLVSESGVIHAPLAVCGDAGGAIRLGIPLPVEPPPLQRPTALQLLYASKEPQRGSVWRPHLGRCSHGQFEDAILSSHGQTDFTPSPRHAEAAANASAVASGRPAARPFSNGRGATAPGLGGSLGNASAGGLAAGTRLLSGWVQPAVAQAAPVPDCAPLPPDWQAMRLRGGMTDFVAVPLLRGRTVIGALQVADACTPSADCAGAMPPSRQCRSAAELSIVGAIIASLLVPVDTVSNLSPLSAAPAGPPKDHEVLCLLGALEAVAAARNVDGLVRALARHVGLFCRMRKHLAPGVRVALIREDAAAMALFLDDGAAAAATAAAAVAAQSVGAAVPDFAAGVGRSAGVLSAAFSRRSTQPNVTGALSSASLLGGGSHSGSGWAERRTATSAGGRRGLRHGPVAHSATDGSLACPSSADACDATGMAGSAPQRPSTGLCHSRWPPDRDPPSGRGSGWRRREQSGDAAAGGHDLLCMAASGSMPGIAVLSGGGGGGGGGLEPALLESSFADLRQWFASVASSTATVAAATIGAADGGGSSSLVTDTLSSIPGAGPAADGCAGHPNATMCPQAGGRGGGGGARRLSVHIVEARCRLLAASSCDLAVAATAGAAGVTGVAAAAAAALAADGTAQEGPSSPSFGTNVPRALLMLPEKVSGSGSLGAVTPTASRAATHVGSGGPTGGIYGRVLASAGDECGTPSGLVRGHAMLTRGTILAEALLLEGTGMYVSDVAIYMQDGRNASRDVFLAHTARAGRAPPPTNSIAVTAIRHGGVPLVGLYLTYATPLPPSLLSSLIAKVHRFGALLGPLLHERVNGESDLADEWRFLLGELLDPRVVGAAASAAATIESVTAAVLFAAAAGADCTGSADGRGVGSDSVIRRSYTDGWLATFHHGSGRIHRQRTAGAGFPADRSPPAPSRLRKFRLASFKSWPAQTTDLADEGGAAVEGAAGTPAAGSLPTATSPSPPGLSTHGSTLPLESASSVAPPSEAASPRPAQPPRQEEEHQQRQAPHQQQQQHRQPGPAGLAAPRSRKALHAGPAAPAAGESAADMAAVRAAAGGDYELMRVAPSETDLPPNKPPACLASPQWRSQPWQRSPAQPVPGAGEGLQGGFEGGGEYTAYASGEHLVLFRVDAEDADAQGALDPGSRRRNGSDSDRSTDVELSVQAWQQCPYRAYSRGSKGADGSSLAGRSPSHDFATLEPAVRRRQLLQSPTPRRGPRPPSPLRPRAPANHATAAGGGATRRAPGDAADIGRGGGNGSSLVPLPEEGAQPPPDALRTHSDAFTPGGGGGSPPTAAGTAGAMIERQWSETLSPFLLGSWVPSPQGSSGATSLGPGPHDAAGRAGSSALAVMPRAAALRRSHLSTSFHILPDPGAQDAGKVAPLMANLQDKLRSLQAEQVLARLHSGGTEGDSPTEELVGLTLLEPLGSGGFGAVYRGIYNGIEVAVKVLCACSGGRSEAATMREAFELAVMTTVSHPHIVQVLSAFTDVIVTTRPDPGGGPPTTVVLPRSPETEGLGEPTVAIAMEFCDAGSLADALAAGRFRRKVPGGFGALEPWLPGIYATLLEVALALRHMHAMQLVHCDLKPANVLLKSNMRDPRGFSAKLSDFGLVKMVLDDSGGTGGVIGRDVRTGTITHMAPELIAATEDSCITASADVYAFGVLMWEMHSGCNVYLGVNSGEIRRRVAEGSLRPEFPPWADERYRSLADACLHFLPAARPSSAQLVAQLRELLAEGGALQDIKKRAPARLADPGAFPHLGGGAAAAATPGYPSSETAAAAGAMLGVRPSAFARASGLVLGGGAQPESALPPAAAAVAAGCGGQARHQPPHAWPFGGLFGAAAGGAAVAAAEHGNMGQPSGRRGRSRSYSGANSSNFPLHIL